MKVLIVAVSLMCSGILVLAAPSNGSNDGIDHPDQSITIGKPITDDEIQTAGQLPPGYGEQVSGNAGLTNNGTEKPEVKVIEGDIVASQNGNNRNLESNLWPDRVVPYEISATFTENERLVIAKAFKDFHDFTCIKFVDRASTGNPADYIRFIKGQGCYSSVGKVGGSQDVSLGSNCVQKGVVIHELMHALGVQHTQSRPDRDTYVTILSQNIRAGMEHNFDKSSGTTTFGDYDFCSTMHYGESFFSSNGQPTLAMKTPKTLYCGSLGQSIGFSDLDVKTLLHLYPCPSGTTKPEYSFCNQLPDYQTACPSYAKEGYCSKDSVNHAYMMQNCPKSCKICELAGYTGIGSSATTAASSTAASTSTTTVATTTTTTTTTKAPTTTTGSAGNCFDAFGNCGDYISDCTDPFFGPWMLENCPKTCNSC